MGIWKYWRNIISTIEDVSKENKKRMCFFRKVSGLVRSSVGLKKKRHFKKEKRIFGWREQRWGHTAKARDLPHFSATSVGGRTQSTAKEKGKDTKRGQTQTQVVLWLGRCDGGARNLKMKGSGDSLKDGHNVRATTTKQGTRRERDATTDFFRTPIGRGVWICRHGFGFFYPKVSWADLKPWTMCPLN